MCEDNGNFTGAYLDKNLYSQLTRRGNDELSNAFFSDYNLDVVQTGLVQAVNNKIREANPKSKCAISRQSDREVRLLMVEFFNHYQTMISTAGSAMSVGNKSSVFNQPNVPATFMFSDPSNTYIPGWFDKPQCLQEKMCDNGGNYRCDDKNYGGWHYLKRYIPDTIPQRCVGNKRYVTDVPIYNPDVPITIKVKYLNRKFIEFLAPRVLYEVKNKLKYHYFTADPYACFVDHPDYEANRNNKGLSLQKYYNSKEEIYKPHINPESIRFPKLRRHLEGEKYNCVTERTLDADLVNPRVPMGETDILFPREEVEWRFKARRRKMPNEIYYS